MRRLVLLPVMLLVATALVGPGTALAAEKSAESGYSQKANKPKESTGTSPSKETSKPTTPGKETEPSTPTSTSTPEAEKSSTLPFTGFNLTWVVGAGLLLMGAGFSIVGVQRRQRREH